MKTNFNIIHIFSIIQFEKNNLKSLMRVNLNALETTRSQEFLKKRDIWITKHNLRHILHGAKLYYLTLMLHFSGNKNIWIHNKL